MCTFTTSWLAKEQQFSQLENTLQLLKEMEADKLLEIHPDKLIVTESGKPFIRNICMAFDVKLQENKPETRIFSMTV
jgi:oxygen-independent coproporphyrinogen-3 oxidase